MFKLPKGSAKTGAIVIGAIAVGGIVYLIYKKFFEFEQVDVVLAETELSDEVVAISMENIEFIAQDIALEEDEKISQLTLQLNEQFTELEKSREQVEFFQNEVNRLNVAIIAETARINSFYDSQISRASSQLAGAQSAESGTFREYTQINNELTKLQVQFQNLQAEADEVALNPFIAVFRLPQIGLEMNGVKDDMRRIEGSVANAWNEYINAQNAVRGAVTDYNEALASKSTEEQSVLIPLREQLVASRNSLNTWQIAFSAAEIVMNELKNTIAALGAQ